MKKDRLIANLILLLVVLYLPYWVYLPLVGAAAILFPLYWEAIIFGFIIDALYGTHLFRFSFFFALLLLILLPVRERLRFSF